MTKDVLIEYEGHLPSVNHMYGRTKFGGMYLKLDGKRLKADVMASTKGKLPKDVEIGYELTVMANFYNSGKKTKTRIKKRDSNNLVKLIVDGCCEALGVDDSQVFEEKVMKLQSDKEGFKARFYLLNN